MMNVGPYNYINMSYVNDYSYPKFWRQIAEDNCCSEYVFVGFLLALCTNPTFKCNYPFSKINTSLKNQGLEWLFKKDSLILINWKLYFLYLVLTGFFDFGSNYYLYLRIFFYVTYLTYFSRCIEGIRNKASNTIAICQRYKCYSVILKFVDGPSKIIQKTKQKTHYYSKEYKENTYGISRDKREEIIL